MNILIFNSQIKANSFLKTQFEIEDYRDLVIGKKTYYQSLLETISSWQEAKIFFHSGALESFAELGKFLQYHNVTSQHYNLNTNVYYYDLEYFPVDFEKINNIFDKLQYTEDLILFFTQQAQGKKFLPFYKTRLAEVYNNLTNNQSIWSKTQSMIDIDVTDDFLSLTKTNDTLKLFASNFQPRFFNQISAENEFFVKTSSNKAKILAEYNFLANIPLAIRPYYPQIGEYKDQGSKASYQVEKVYMFDLSKLLVNKVISQANLSRIFLEKIELYFNQCPKKSINKEEFRQVILNNFNKKNSERLEQIKELPILVKLNQIAVLKGFKNIDEICQIINTEIEKNISTLANKDLYYSHGDLCFSNILFDPHTYAVKFIDPRGYKDSIDETFRPIYYDLAKLSHSFIGLYDLIVYDAVEIQVAQNGDLELNYQIQANQRETLATEFANFVDELGIDLKILRLFEASLFLSMIPLHKESEKRMLCQLIQAIDSLIVYRSKAKNSNIITKDAS